MKAALLIIDLQKAYYTDEQVGQMDQAAWYIREALKLFRGNNLPIVWIQDVDSLGGVVPGTEGFEMIDVLGGRQESEYSVYKYYGNSFNKTNLAELLANHGVDTVVLAGYCAEYCVFNTYRGAMDQDLTPVLLRDAIVSGDSDNLRFIMKLCDSVSLNILAKVLG